MKINVALNQKSIKDAINKLRSVRKVIPEMQYEFLQYICEWIIEKANERLYASDIGENVKWTIANSWEYDIDKSIFGAKITNRAQQAAFVEFGVGTVGRWKNHPNASETNYQYNVGSQIRDDGSWIFGVSDDADIDISAKYVSSRTENTVMTYGSPAVMYAYNAIVDARTDLKNPNGEIQAEWKRLKSRYIG